jgi:hypothetical protein
LPGFFITRRVSEGRMREDIASDVTSSLAYASGCDWCEDRNFKARERGAGDGLAHTPFSSVTWDVKSALRPEAGSSANRRRMDRHSRRNDVDFEFECA